MTQETKQKVLKVLNAYYDTNVEYLEPEEVQDLQELIITVEEE